MRSRRIAASVVVPRKFRRRSAARRDDRIERADDRGNVASRRIVEGVGAIAGGALISKRGVLLTLRRRRRRPGNRHDGSAAPLASLQQAGDCHAA